MKNTILAVVLVAVIVVIIVIVAGRGGDDKVSTNASLSPSPTVVASPKATANPILTYQEAIKKYEGTRIQFDARCQATPNQITVKNGAAVMLDNRSGDARNFSVGATKYVLAGYGFRIITASSKTLPATLVIDCGSAQNVGRILVQK